MAVGANNGQQVSGNRKEQTTGGRQWALRNWQCALFGGHQTTGSGLRWQQGADSKCRVASGKQTAAGGSRAQMTGGVAAGLK